MNLKRLLIGLLLIFSIGCTSTSKLIIADKLSQEYLGNTIRKHFKNRNEQPYRVTCKLAAYGRKIEGIFTAKSDTYVCLAEFRHHNKKSFDCVSGYQCWDIYYVDYYREYPNIGRPGNWWNY